MDFVGPPQAADPVTGSNRNIAKCKSLGSNRNANGSLAFRMTVIAGHEPVAAINPNDSG